MPKDQETSTIMVVDDTPANLRLLEKMLQSDGYRVLVFPSGQLALDAASRKSPDLILLDINMPIMDGFEVCKRLKTNPRLQEIPVIFLSALTDTINKVKAFSAGGVDYVTKPFQYEEVCARVKTHLRIRRMQQELELHNLHLEELVNAKIAEISDSKLAAIVALAKLAESRDDETGQHVERTRIFCKLLASKLRQKPRYADSINEAFIENIYHASALHDIGKVGILDSTLLKPGKFNSQEFDTMKRHTTIGANTLQKARGKYTKNAFLNMGIAIARSHQEKWDGSGYPDGLAGEDIPLSARIMAVADVYDALRSSRPYKTPFSHEESSTIILKGAGNHFDPAVVDVFDSVNAEFATIRDQTNDTITIGVDNGC